MTTGTLELVQPLHLWVPERRGSYGDEAIDLAELAGRRLDAEQRLAVDAMLSYRERGRWAALEQCIIEARQNGKTTGVIEPVVLFDLFMLEPDRIVWTAHLFKTARDAFNDFDTMIAATPELSRRVKKINYSHGEEAVELTNGALLEFLARSQGGGRGLGGKRNVFDEALILAAGTMGAIFPVISARPNAQVTYGSSAGKLGSDHLRSLRDRGRAGDDPSLVYVEWADDGTWENPPCADGKDCSHLYGVKGCALDDEIRWKRANHTAGQRITYEYIRAERRALGRIPIEFGRERCGWWEDPPNDGEEPPPVDMTRWATLADPEVPQPTGEVALAIEVPRDRSSTSIGVAWWLDAQRVMVMVTELPGTTKAPAFVKALTGLHDVVDVSLHAGGPAGALVASLEHEGVEVRTVSTQEAAQATGAFLDRVSPPKDESGTVTDEKLLGHLDQAELNAALAAARLRDVGGAKIWDLTDALANRAPLFAVTLAAHGCVKHSKPPAPFFGAWR